LDRNWNVLKRILLWEAALGLAAASVLGAVAGLLAIRANAYLGQHLPRAAFYTFNLQFDRWVISGLVATALVAAVISLCFASSNRRRAIGLFVSVPVALLASYFVGYEINRFDFKTYWLAPHSFLGLPLRAALFEKKVVLANLGVLVVSVLAGWIAYRLVSLAVRMIERRQLRMRAPRRPEWILLAVVVAVIGFEGFAGIYRLRHQARGPNVILISLDTLRRDHLGCYGYGRDVSPRIDQLAATSVLFENAITQAGSTLSSHKSVMTSVYPPMLRVPGDQRLDRRRQTIAEILLDKGYATAAFANGLGWVTPVFRFDQGFGKYVVPSRRIVPKLASAEEITRLGLAWAGKHRRGSFFLFLHYGDIHSDWGNLPYEAPEPYGSMFVPPASDRFDRSREEIRASSYLSAINWGRYDPSAEEIEYIKALYDGGIRYTDYYIGALVDGLRDLGVLDTSLVVIFSDHGEEFREHGRMLHGWVYCEVARVPLIVRFPGGEWGGTRVAGQVELLDVAPTILSALGISSGPEMRGRDLTAALREPGPGGVSGGSAFIEGEDAYALRRDGWMYLLDFEDGHNEVYDIASDPKERLDLLGRFPEREGDLSGELLAWIGRVEAQALRGDHGEPARLDRKTRELLKSLGYLQSGK
jgi:arylsulfatase A-like enzyme